MPGQKTRNTFYWITWEVNTVSLCHIRKEKFLSKNFTSATWKLVPGPFLFAKNQAQPLLDNGSFKAT